MDNLLSLLIKGKAEDFKTTVKTMLTDALSSRKNQIRREVAAQYSTKEK